MRRLASQFRRAVRELILAAVMFTAYEQVPPKNADFDRRSQADEPVAETAHIAFWHNPAAPAAVKGVG